MLSRRQILAGSLSLPAIAAKKPAAARPNLVVIAASGVSSWMLGCYGNREIRTPNLDRMAQAGARFAASFTSAGTAAEGRAALLGAAPEALARASYQCGEAKDPSEVCRWIGQRGTDQPFFLTVDLPLPFAAHDPKYDALYAGAKLDSVNYEPVSPKAAGNREMFTATLENVRRAAAAVTALDDQAGVVIECVRRRNQGDNTLVVFTSTCGALLGRHGLWGDALASDPPNLYDEVVAVPMIWTWASRVPPASIRPELVSARDFVPTLCELSGAALPANTPGRSYAAPAMNRPLPKKQPWRNLVFARAGNTAMVRDNRYKLVQRNNGAGPNELFDVTADPRERVNQYDNPQFVTVRTRLQAELK